MTTLASLVAVDPLLTPTTRKYPQPMKRLRLVLASLALTAVPLITQATTAEAAWLSGCYGSYNWYNQGAARCDTINGGLPGLGQVRGWILCHRYGSTQRVNGPWVGLATWSRATCPLGWDTPTWNMELR